MNRRRTSLGVSLIEALVALAVMGFGMVGVVALQVAMRHNSDVAKQRSEATRLAQEAIETRRAFTTMSAAPSGFLDWSDLQSTAAEIVNGTNAIYSRTVLMPDVGSGRSKNFIVTVTWEDRTGAQQEVRLLSAITGSDPLLATSVGVPESATLLSPQRRHPGIPPGAVTQRDGTTSHFTPPGSSGHWVFNNATGIITQNCSAPNVCTNVEWLALWGYVNFATGAVEPTEADAEHPSGLAFNLDIALGLDAPAVQPTFVPACLKDMGNPLLIAYYCVVDVAASTTPKHWSGRSTLTGGSLLLAASAPDVSASSPTHHKVCRYTPVRGCDPLVGDIIWGAVGTTASCTGAAPTSSRKMSNAEHPRDYSNVSTSLGNQNFLIITAGNGTAAFDCPDDAVPPVTPLVQSTTWRHQGF